MKNESTLLKILNVEILQYLSNHWRKKSMQKHFFLYEESQKKKFQTDQRIFWHWSLKGEAHS